MEDRYAIGVDLGGTKIEIACIDSKGKVLKKLRLATNVQGGPEVVQKQIIDVIHEIQSDLSIQATGIGIGVAGQIDFQKGVVIFAPNLNWHHFPLREKIVSIFHKPVFLINDVKAAAWGEWLFGAGVGCQDLVCMLVGTGIGGAIVSNGKMLDGSSNTCGEIGHMTVDMRGPRCTCGNRGCLEAVSGGWAIAQQAREAIHAHPHANSMLLQLAQGKIDNVTAKTVIEGVRMHDYLSQLILEQVKQGLIAGCVSIVNAINPSKLILGGGVIDGAPELIPLIEWGIREHALQAAVSSLHVVSAKLGKEANVIGAAAFAMRSLNDAEI